MVVVPMQWTWLHALGFSAHLKTPEGPERSRHPCNVAAVLWERCGQLRCDERLGDAPQDWEDYKP